MRLAYYNPRLLFGPLVPVPGLAYLLLHLSDRSASLALPTAGSLMPSADFCSAVRRPCGRLSRLWATRSRPPGVSSIAFSAQPPDLRFASLMDMDFATSCPLVRRWRLVSGFCSSARTFAPRFLQTPPRGDSPCVLANPSPPSGWVETFTSELLNMLGTRLKRFAVF